MEQIKLNTPKGVASVSFGGEEYTVVKGVVSVPAEAVPELIAQGFSAVEQSE